MPTKTTWRSGQPMSKKKPSGRPTGYEEKTSRQKNAKEKSQAEKTNAGKTRLRAKAKNLHLTSDIVFKRKEKHDGLTVCVTCAGVGTAKPSSQKNAKA
jgi:hypothetical protein